MVQGTWRDEMVLLIDSADIAQIDLKPIEVIKAVESAYRQDGLGLAEETPRLEIKIKGKDLPHIAPGTTSVGHGMAYLEESKVFITSYAYHFDFHKYINEIIDPETGQTLAIIKRTRGAFGTEPGAIDSGMLRTGAAAAIGAKYMANKNVEAVGIIGINIRNTQILFEHNHRKAYPLIDNKAETKKLCVTNDLPVPKTYGIITKYGDTKNIRRIIGNDCEQFVMKPARGSTGRGIIIIQQIKLAVPSHNSSPKKPVFLSKYYCPVSQ